MIKFRAGWNPGLRVLLFLNALALAAIGAPVAVAVVTIISLAGLVARERSNEKSIGLRAAIIYLFLALLFAVPTKDIRPEYFLGPLRLFAAMLVSILFILATSPSDFIYLARLTRMRFSAVFIITAIARYVPIAFEAFRDVLLAQRCRGLKLNMAATFHRSTYRALLIPVLVSVVRNANALWIGMHLRPITSFSPVVAPPLRIHGVFLVSSILLWFLN